MKDDLISRQAAIDSAETYAEMLRRVLDDTDIVRNDRDKFAWGLGLIESFISDLKELQSAEPEPSRDVVDRATMLETYAELYDMFDSYPNICNDIHVVYDKLRNLPSAQPERKKGKWLMNGERYGHMYWRCSHCGEEVDYIGANFCSNCGSYNGGKEDE